MTQTQIERIAAAAANPEQWILPGTKHRRKRTSKLAARQAKEHKQDLRSDQRRLNTAHLIDAAILALVDLAPERLGWRVVGLCERLISDENPTAKGTSMEMQARIDTVRYMEAVTELISLFPPVFAQEAMGHVTALMVAAGRCMVGVGATCMDRRSLERWGWLAV